MKYLCLAYYDERKFATLTEADMAAIGRDCRPLDEELQRSGHLLEVGSLAATRDSVSLRPRNGKVTVTDGPYARDEGAARQLLTHRGTRSERGNPGPSAGIKCRAGGGHGYVRAVR